MGGKSNAYASEEVDATGGDEGVMNHWEGKGGERCESGLYNLVKPNRWLVLPVSINHSGSSFNLTERAESGVGGVESASDDSLLLRHSRFVATTYSTQHIVIISNRKSEILNYNNSIEVLL